MPVIRRLAAEAMTCAFFLTVDRQEQRNGFGKETEKSGRKLFERIWIPLEERYFWKAGVEKTCDTVWIRPGCSRAERGSNLDVTK